MKNTIKLIAAFIAISIVIKLTISVVSTYELPFLLNYLFVNITAGGGIAIDVMLATVVLYKNPDLSWKTWTLPVTITHVGFPAFGYYGFWGAGEAVPWLSPFIGLLGAFIVAVFLLGAYCEWIEKEPFIDFPTIGKSLGLYWVAKHSKPAAAFLGRLGIASVFALLATVVAPEVLAVSWDALASGPAKSAIIAEWTREAVWLSFLIAGAFVAVVATASLKAAKWLNGRTFESAPPLAAFIALMRQAEVSVIGGFGVLSAWGGFSNKANLTDSILIASVFFLVVTMIFWVRFWNNAHAEAEEAVEIANDNEEGDDESLAAA